MEGRRWDMEGLTPVETTVSTSVSLKRQRLSLPPKKATWSPPTSVFISPPLCLQFLQPPPPSPLPPLPYPPSHPQNRRKMRLTIFNFMIATLSDYQCPRLALNSVLSLLVGRKKLAYGGSLLSKIFPIAYCPPLFRSISLTLYLLRKWELRAEPSLGNI